MSINLPQSGSIFLPKVPKTIEDPEVVSYLNDLRNALSDGLRGLFDNSFIIATAINLGISGTFTVSSGGSIVVTSGIVINVTS